MSRNRFLTGVAIGAAAVAATATVVVAVPSSSSAATAASYTVPNRWVHHADVDGDGNPDRVVLVRGNDLKVRQGAGTGHFHVRVHLATGAAVHRRMRVNYYYGVRHGEWTPWFGKAQLDHVVGREIVVGKTSGAHTQVYNALAYQGGRLVKIDAPGNGPEHGWVVNSSVGTGSWGYKCTNDGVMTRLVYPNNDGSRYHIDRKRFVRTAATWERTRHRHYTVDADKNGQPPAYTDNYATFACKGLPRSW